MKVLARKTIGQVGYGNWWTFVLIPKFGWCPEISKTGRFPRWAKELAFQWPTDLALVTEYTAVS